MGLSRERLRMRRGADENQGESMKVARNVRSWISDWRLRRRFARAYSEAAGTARPGPHAMVVVLDHPLSEGSPAMVVRVADAFGARAVYIIGTSYFYPPRSLENVPVRFFGSFDAVYEDLHREGYVIYALAPTPSRGAPQFLHTTELPQKTAFVIGNERRGLTFLPDEYEGVTTLTIAQYGAIPWLQAGIAAALAMYEYACQHGRPRTV